MDDLSITQTKRTTYHLTDAAWTLYKQHKPMTERTSQIGQLIMLGAVAVASGAMNEQEIEKTRVHVSKACVYSATELNLAGVGYQLQQGVEGLAQLYKDVCHDVSTMLHGAKSKRKLEGKMAMRGTASKTKSDDEMPGRSLTFYDSDLFEFFKTYTKTERDLDAIAEFGNEYEITDEQFASLFNKANDKKKLTRRFKRSDVPMSEVYKGIASLYLNNKTHNTEGSIQNETNQIVSK